MCTFDFYLSLYSLLSLSFLCNFFSCALVSLNDSVCHLGNDQLYGSDSVIIARDYIVQLFRITVGISDSDKRNTQCMCFLYADSLLLRVYYEDRIREFSSCP